jgi:hypothetical protein
MVTGWSRGYGIGISTGGYDASCCLLPLLVFLLLFLTLQQQGETFTGASQPPAMI